MSLGLEKKNTFLKKLLPVIFIGICTSFFLLGCESQYDKGYKKGYNEGYDRGYNEGYSKGKQSGYTKGYTEGTVTYVRGNALPSLGFALIVLSFCAVTYYGYRHLKNPTKRAIDKSADAIEEVRQQSITQKELKRKKYSIEEQAKIKAHNLASKVFEKTIIAITDENCRAEIEAFKNDAEQKILHIQLEEIKKIADEYEKSIKDLKASKHLSNKEKTDLFKEIRKIFNEA